MAFNFVNSIEENSNPIVIEIALGEEFVDSIKDCVAYLPVIPSSPADRQTNYPKGARCANIKYVDDSKSPLAKEIRDTIAEILVYSARHVYGFDVFGADGLESLEYTEYIYNDTTENLDEQGHMGWHIDSFLSKELVDRKLSFSLQLSDSEDYEGCNLEFLGPQGEPLVASRKKGTLIIFPSFMQHKVSHITKGKRKCLISWIQGAKFR